MKATIVSITYYDDLKYVADARNGEEYWCGYVIELDNDGVIRVLVDNGGQCCEKWGVDMYLLGEVIKDGEYEPADGEALKDAKVRRVAWGDGACVDVQTDRGLVQLVPYNYHDGYYPHTVHVAWPGYSSTEEL